MQVSYSRISTYEKCPYQYKMRYLNGIETIFNCDPQNALVLGHALHTGIEKDIDAAIAEYYAAYPVIKDAHVTEAMKLENLIPRVKAILPKGKHEVKIETDDFVGYIDLLVPRGYMSKESIYNPYGEEVSVYDIYDFKYSNNVNSYLESAQLHLYKYFFELTNPGKRIRNLFFVFIPKCMLKQKYKNKTNQRDETLYEFRKRCLEDLESKEVQVVQVNYNPNKVVEYLIATKHCIEDTEFLKNPTRLCDWCDYKLYCEKGIDFMNLPKNERREKVVNTAPDMWIYADSYVGKSTFVDQIDDVIFANTDGNIGNITSPVVRITDVIEKNGRMTNKTFAWEVFLEFVEELEKKENDFKVVALDLLEDLYEHCRLYMYDKLGVEHEQDAGFGKGWDMVRTEFCSTIKRLKNLGYRIIYISKELKTEINLKNGAKITSYAPNLPDKVANILAGTVTLTVRAYMNNRGRFLQLAKEENVFGGGRFDFVNDTCPLDMDAFVKELELAQRGTSESSQRRSEKSNDSLSKDEEKSTESDSEVTGSESKRKHAKSTDTAEEQASNDEPTATEGSESANTSNAEEAPKRRTRKKRDE